MGVFDSSKDFIYFLANKAWWRPIFYLINIWKETGWGTIIFLATLSGINVAKTRMIAYMITGFATAVGAIFTTARLQSATTAIGTDFEFNPIAAAVVGGAALSGGSGDVIGTLIGALFMATLENGVRKLDMNTSFQYIIKGVIIIAVVIFDATYKARMERKAREQGAKEGLE